MFIKNIQVLLTAAVLAFAVSCGATPEDTDKAHGGIFRVDSFKPADDSTDVDTVAQVCDGGTLEIKARTKQSGTVTLSNLAVGGGDEPSDIRVDRYTIDYFPLDNGGELSSVEFITSDIIPGGGSAGIAIEMVPLVTKAEFRAFYVPITGSTTQSTFRYELAYEFFGKDEFNVEVSTKGSTVLTLGNFIICD